MSPSLKHCAAALLCVIAACSGSRRGLDAALKPVPLTSADAAVLERLSTIVFSHADYLMGCAANHCQLYPDKNSPQRGRVFYSLPGHQLSRYLAALPNPPAVPDLPVMSALDGRERVFGYDMDFRPSDRALSVRICQRVAGSRVVEHLVVNFPREIFPSETEYSREKLDGRWSYLIVSHDDDELAALMRCGSALPAGKRI